VSGYLTWSPIVEATDWDEHVARSLHFKETFEEGDLLGVGIEFRYDLDQMGFSGWFLTAGLDYQKIDHILGDMEVRNVETGERGGERDVAGIENEVMVISLGGGVRF
jgi:outer membrane protease